MPMDYRDVMTVLSQSGLGAALLGEHEILLNTHLPSMEMEDIRILCAPCSMCAGMSISVLAFQDGYIG